MTGIQSLSVTRRLLTAARTLQTLATAHIQGDGGPVLQLWEAATGKLIATLSDEYTGGITAFSPDGKTLVTAREMIQFWDATSGKLKDARLGRTENVVQVAFSPDGKTLATLGRNWTIERWSVPDGKLLKSTPFPAADLLPLETFPWALGLAFADNDRVVAWGELWEVALVWEAPSGKMLTPITGHVGAVNAVRFTSDGKEVVTAGVDRRAIRWDAATGRRTEVRAARPHQQFPFTHLTRYPYTHLAPDGTRGLRYGSVFDVTTGEELFHLPLGNPTPTADFRRVAGIGRSRTPGQSPIQYEVWDLGDRRRVARFDPPDSVVSPADGAIAFSPDGSRLVAAVSVNEPGRGVQRPLLVTGWNVATGKRLGELRELVALFATGEESRPHLAAAGNNSGAVLTDADGKLWVADYERGTRGETIAEVGLPLQRFTHPTFSPDGKRFAVGAPTDKPDAYDVRVYDWPRGKLLYTFASHRGAITAAGLFTGRQDSRLRLGRRERTAVGHGRGARAEVTRSPRR